MNRKLGPLAALAMVALIGAGCASTSSESGSGGGSASSSDQQPAARFSECMRGNGISEFPDPDVSGALTIDGIVNGSKLDTSSAAWATAIAACKDLQPSGFMGDERGPDEQDAALAFAQCMRENGVEDFPDPAPDGPLIDTTSIPSAAGRGARSIPGFDAATAACSDAFAGKLGLERP